MVEGAFWYRRVVTGGGEGVSEDSYLKDHAIRNGMFGRP